jgi:hypothetical protein
LTPPFARRTNSQLLNTHCYQQVVVVPATIEEVDYLDFAIPDVADLEAINAEPTTADLTLVLVLQFLRRRSRPPSGSVTAR